MAHKMTAKRVGAIAALKAEGSTPRELSNKDSDTLYTTLESSGYWWNATDGEWQKGKPPSTSIFKDDDGVSTGIVRIRLMGHPDDMPDAIASAKKCFEVAEVSALYPNRKGPGVRVYITALLGDD